MEGFRAAEYGKFIHVSTDEVYGHLTLEEDPFTELSPITPRSPYAASKASSDLLCQAYIETFGCNICITRCCNNYGPNQHSEKFIPTIIRSLSEGKKVPVYGNGLNVREWINVHDHNNAVWLVGARGAPGVYNIGSGLEMNNLELVDSICTLMGKDLESSIEYVDDRLGHDFRYSINSSKIRTDLYWRPTLNDFDNQLKLIIPDYA